MPMLVKPQRVEYTDYMCYVNFGEACVALGTGAIATGGVLVRDGVNNGSSGQVLAGVCMMVGGSFLVGVGSRH